MSMLTPSQIELIHSEIDGENTPEASAEVRKLVETQPEALALMTSLQGLDAIFSQVPDRAPPPHLIQRIHNAMPLNSRASPKDAHAQGSTQTITGWLTQQWTGATNFMGELMSTKKILIGATTAVAAIAIIGYALVGSEPSIFDAGTIGSGDGMGGVTKAERYKGKTISEKDVTLSNPQIMALFQNDQVLKLVKSDVFRELMSSEAYHELMSSEAYQNLMSSEAYQDLMSSEAYQDLMSSEAYQDLMSNDAYLQLMSSEAYQELMSNETYQQLLSSETYQALMKNEAYLQLMKDDAFQNLMSSEAYQNLMSSEAYQALMKNDAYLQLMSNEAYLELMSSDAYEQLMSSDLYLQLSQSPSLSEVFMNEAMRAEGQ